VAAREPQIVGGLEWVDEPEILRFFYGRLRPIGDWQERLVAKFKADFGTVSSRLDRPTSGRLRAICYKYACPPERE